LDIWYGGTFGFQSNGFGNIVCGGCISGSIQAQYQMGNSARWDCQEYILGYVKHFDFAFDLIPCGYLDAQWYSACHDILWFTDFESYNISHRRVHRKCRSVHCHRQ
jgi:hypothetical protein